MVTDLDAAYLAGLIDGEGAIQISVTRTREQVTKHRLTVTLATVDIEEMQALAALWGKGVILMPSRQGTRPHARIHWTSASAVDLLRQIRPYVRLKRKHVDLALSFAALLNGPENRSKPITPERWAEREQTRKALAAIQVKRPRRLTGDPQGVEQYVRPRPEFAHTCANCGDSFTSTDLRSRYCSKRCQKQMNYANAKGRSPLLKSCPACRVEFRTHQKKQVFCSIACGRQGAIAVQGTALTGGEQS